MDTLKETRNDGIKTSLSGAWQEFTGKMKSLYGDLTDDHFKMLDGKTDEFVGAVKGKYGETKATEAQKHIDEYQASCGDNCGCSSKSTGRAA